LLRGIHGEVDPHIHVREGHIMEDQEYEDVICRQKKARVEAEVENEMKRSVCKVRKPGIYGPLQNSSYIICTVI
jgi:hypothetical protein